MDYRPLEKTYETTRCNQKRSELLHCYTVKSLLFTKLIFSSMKRRNQRCCRSKTMRVYAYVGGHLLPGPLDRQNVHYMCLSNRHYGLFINIILISCFAIVIKFGSQNCKII